MTTVDEYHRRLPGGGFTCEWLSPPTPAGPSPPTTRTRTADIPHAADSSLQPPAPGSAEPYDNAAPGTPTSRTPSTAVPTSATGPHSTGIAAVLPNASPRQSAAAPATTKPEHHGVSR